MKSRLIIVFGMILILGLVVVAGQGSFYTGDTRFQGGGSSAISVTHQYRPSYQAVYGPEGRFERYWPILGDRDTCESRQDLLLQVAPLGCTPSVVRSDLLAEQNVPVFCQVDGLQVNPLIDIKRIRNIGFSRAGGYPKEVAGTGFHPARAALRTRDRLLGDPLINNLGYVVVVLKKTDNEDDLPDNVNLTLTAQMNFEASNAYGIGRADFVLRPMSDSEWARDRDKQSFWNGRYFVRLESVDAEFAIVSLYFGDRKISTLKVKKGETSRPVYVPGEVCRGGVQVNYDGFVAARKKAKIEISNKDGRDVLDVYEGSNFLNGKCRVSKINIKDSFGNVTMSCGGGLFGGRRGEILLGVRPFVKSNSTEDGTEAANFVDETLGGEAEIRFSDAIRNYEILAEDYPNERQVLQEGGKVYGEEALRAAIELARSAEESTKKSKLETRSRLLNKYVELYPAGKYFHEYDLELRELFDVDRTNAGRVVEIDSEFYTVRLLELEAPRENSSAVLRLVGKGKSEKISEDEEREIGGSDDVVKKVRLERVIDRETVEIIPFCWEGSGKDREEKKGSSIRLRLGEDPKNICKTERIQLDDVDLKELAKIRLDPLSQGTRIETNLSVNIGIEKRAIKLSPEKTEEVIENLNKSIKKWEKINDGLGKLVSGLKGACFATAGVLTVKNFFEGIGGGALARKQVMEGSNGWKQRCRNAIDLRQIDRNGNGNFEGVGYQSMTECFNGEKDLIEKEIEAAKAANNKVNGDIRAIEESGNIKTGDALSGYVVDEREAMKKYYGQLTTGEFENDPIVKELQKPDEDGSAPYTYKDLREIQRTLVLKKELEQRGLETGYVDEDYRELKDSLDENKKILEDYQSRQEGGGLFGREVDVTGEAVNKEVGFIILSGDDRAQITGNEIRDGATHGVLVTGYNKLDNGKPTGRGTYMVVGTKLAGELVPSEIYKATKKSDGKVELSSAGDLDLGDFLSHNKVDRFEDVSTDLFGNGIAPNYKKVRFFETGPDKGLPGIVPFDEVNGWYVKVDSNLNLGNQLAAYDRSGLPRNWKICNVGRNGGIDLNDKCQLVQQGYSGRILGLDLRQSQKLIRDSQEALLNAGAQYGESVIRIGRQEFFQGAPVTAFDSVECQDYMGIEDCQVMFNVCDPVICPASRCDFGGEYPVSDVIQTGIVGGALLCLPNAKEGIFAPVCLSGIHAGIEGYVSVMKNYRDCLSESLDSGQLVGVCDYMYSIYLCDFFWRQAAPVAEVLLPKAVELASGKIIPTKGGGEYLDVQTAWDNAGKSTEFFTQSYAVNSLKAFQLRDSAEVGTQFCKAFVGAKGPESFKSLVEPESPSQFHAWFSSTKYTDVTLPPTAQYKVFYHIFAGNDVGTQYQVYLKSPPDSNFYYNVPTIMVASGFVGRGQYASETKEFTSPEGYKELCVRVNDKEECGFQQVSTSFAVNQLRDGFVSEKIVESDIRSEVECVSGSRSAANFGSLVNPNIQAGAEETVFPKDYNRGIVRICASDNPGGGTEGQRYVDVGHCGDTEMRCWLDKRSVENAITDNSRGVVDETLSELENVQRDRLIELGEIDSEDKAVSNIREFGDDVKKNISYLRNPARTEAEIGSAVGGADTLVAKGNDIFERLFLNHHKAEVLLLSGGLRGEVAEALIRGVGEVSRAEDAGDGRDEVVDDSGGEKAFDYYLSVEFETIDSIADIRKVVGGDEKIVLNIRRKFLYPSGSTTSIGSLKNLDGNYIIVLKENAPSEYLLFDGAIILDGTNEIKPKGYSGEGIWSIEFYVGDEKKEGLTIDDEVTLKVGHSCDSVRIQISNGGDYDRGFELLKDELEVEIGNLIESVPSEYTVTAVCNNGKTLVEKVIVKNPESGFR